ncbi:MAG: glycosyltransferase family 4 protein [Actinomycetota bacterium]
MKIVLVTNDFPPRIGGIQTYLWNIYRRLAEGGVDVTVIARDHQEAERFDALAPMRIVRRREVIFPSSSLMREVREHARDADLVTIGATLPMAQIVSKIDRPLVIHTHGFEIGWAKMPGAASLLRRIMSRAALVTHITRWTGQALAPVFRDAPRALIPTGVDVRDFPSDLDGRGLRDRLGLGDRPVISFVSRLVRRKGADTLIEAMPRIRAQVPDAALVIVGDGADRARVAKLAAASPAADAIHVTGAVPAEELPDAYAAGDVFAMPCRSRYGGLEVEGLGLVYLEAQACARPAITGDSGGAPEAVRHGETGYTVPGGDATALVEPIAGLLKDRERARRMGLAARRFMETTYDWDLITARFRNELEALL